MINPTEGECKNCGLLKSTCELPNGDEWVKNCQRIEGKKHEFGEGEKELREGFINHPKLAGAHGYCNEVFANKIADYWIEKFKALEARKEAELTAFKEKIQELSDTWPEYQSDDYDKGMKWMKNRVLEIITSLKE